MGLGPIHDDVQVMSEEEYEFMMMEFEEEEMQGAQVVEISDDESEGKENMEDGGEDVHMVMFGANMQGMGQIG